LKKKIALLIFVIARDSTSTSNKSRAVVAQNKTDSSIVKDIDQLEKGSISVDRFIALLDQQRDEEILSQIEQISRCLLKQINSETERVLRGFSRRLLGLFEKSTSKNTQFLVALIQFDSEHLIQNADYAPELVIRWLCFLDPSLKWIVRVSRSASSRMYKMLLRVDSDLIGSELVQRIVDELNDNKFNRQQNEFLFKLLTRSFTKRSELIDLISDRLIDLCARLPITTNLELSISFLAVLQRPIDSVEIGKELAKKLEKVYLLDKKYDPDELLEKGLLLFFNKIVPSVIELIPLLAFDKWKDALVRTLSSMSDESLLRNIFENTHLCLQDHAGLDKLFRLRPSLIYAISSTQLCDQAFLDGSGALRRVSNSWLIMIPPTSKHDVPKRQLPLSSTGVEGWRIYFLQHLNCIY